MFSNSGGAKHSDTKPWFIAVIYCLNASPLHQIDSLKTRPRGRRGYDAPMLRCSGLGEEGEEEKRVNGVATAFSGYDAPMLRCSGLREEGEEGEEGKKGNRI